MRWGKNQVTKARQQAIDKKKRELHDKLHKIWHVVIAAKQCLFFSKDLLFSEAKEVNRFLSQSSHFRFIHTALWKQCVIELTKLFSDNERTHKFNIHRLVHQLEEEGHFSTLNYNQTSVRNWKQRITENSSKIRVVEELRNKVYAHTDPNFDVSALAPPTYKEIECLINIAEEIICEIGSTVFSEHIATDRLPHYDERFSRMLSDFVKFKEQRTKTWFEEERKKWPSE